MNLTRSVRRRHAGRDTDALAPEDILVTHLLADPVGGWNTKLR